MLAGLRDLPLDRDASARYLPWLVAVMVYLAALGAISALAMGKIAERWDKGLAGKMTVQVPLPAAPGAAESQEALAAVVAILTAAPGVARVVPLTPEESDALLEPWLGPEASRQGLPLPVLIALEVEPATPPEPAALQARLQQVVPGVLVDDHQRWLSGLLDLARLIELISLAVVALVGGAAVITVVFVTRMGLAVHRDIISLLHLIGAQDSYVAAQFQSHAFKLGLLGGLGGLAAAAVTLLLLTRLLRQLDGALLPDFQLLPGEWAILAALPLAAAMLMLVTARVTVLRTLVRMP